MNLRTFHQLGTFDLSFRTANLSIICSVCSWFPGFYVFTGMFEELALFCFSHLPLKISGISEFRVCCKAFLDYSTRWFKYDRDWLCTVYTQKSPSYLNHLVHSLQHSVFDIQEFKNTCQWQRIMSVTKDTSLFLAVMHLRVFFFWDVTMYLWLITSLCFDLSVHIFKVQ